MRDTTIPHVDRVICVPATTRLRGLNSEIALDEHDGMPRSCVLSTDNIGGAETKAAESSMRDPKTILGGAFD